MAHILIIDDDPTVGAFLQALLTAGGHRVTVRTDGENGLAAARADLPDLVICDMHLPRMTGWQVMRELKAGADTRAVPVIALTAYGTAPDRDEAYDAGCDAYEGKPIDVDRLLLRVTDLLGARMRQA